MSKKLTAEFIAMRTKCDRIENIKNLNLWGNELEDVSVLSRMPNLEVVSLSVNKIRSLKDFSSLKNLRELYLRKNMISDVNEVRYLVNCQQLRTLWLSENPVADTKNYRGIIIKALPQLTKLDDAPVSPDEKLSANNMQSESNNFNEDEKSWDETGMDNNEENVFENNNYENDYNYERNNNNKNQYANINSNINDYNNKNNNEIYSNNDKKQKMKDKFMNNNINEKNVEKPNPTNFVKEKPNVHKRLSANHQQDEDLISNNFENFNIQDPKKMKRAYTELNENNENYYDNKHDNNKYESKFESNYEKKIPTKNEKPEIKKKSPNATSQSASNDNILNCVIMLLKELNEAELQTIRREIDKKINKY